MHDSPPVYLVEDFLTDEECQALIETAGPLLQRSKTHAAAGSEATVTDERPASVASPPLADVCGWGGMESWRKPSRRS